MSKYRVELSKYSSMPCSVNVVCLLVFELIFAVELHCAKTFVP